MNKIVNAARRLFIFNDMLNLILLSSIVVCFVLPVPYYVFITLGALYLISTIGSMLRILDRHLVSMEKNKGGKFIKIGKLLVLMLAAIASLAAVVLMVLSKCHVCVLPFWPISVIFSVSFGLNIVLAGFLGICSLWCKDETLDSKILHLIMFGVAIGTVIAAIWHPFGGQVMFFCLGIALTVLAVFKMCRQNIHTQELYDFDLNVNNYNDANTLERHFDKSATNSFNTPYKASLFAYKNENKNKLRVERNLNEEFGDEGNDLHSSDEDIGQNIE